MENRDLPEAPAEGDELVDLGVASVETKGSVGWFYDGSPTAGRWGGTGH